jgi:hypothetical protein
VEVRRVGKCCEISLRIALAVHHHSVHRARRFKDISLVRWLTCRRPQLIGPPHERAF